MLSRAASHLCFNRHTYFIASVYHKRVKTNKSSTVARKISSFEVIKCEKEKDEEKNQEHINK